MRLFGKKYYTVAFRTAYLLLTEDNIDDGLGTSSQLLPYPRDVSHYLASRTFAADRSNL